MQEALGESVYAAKDGLLALSVGVGLGVLAEMVEAEVDEVVGPKHAKLPDRTAVRHGHEAGEVTLGGRRVAVKRPARADADGEREVPLASYAHFADRDPLTRVVREQLLAGVSWRRFTRTREPVGEEVVNAERSTSKSAVSRELVGRTREHLEALMSRSLSDVQRVGVLRRHGDLPAAEEVDPHVDPVGHEDVVRAVAVVVVPGARHAPAPVPVDSDRLHRDRAEGRARCRCERGAAGESSARERERMAGADRARGKSAQPSRNGTELKHQGLPLVECVRWPLYAMRKLTGLLPLVH